MTEWWSSCNVGQVLGRRSRGGRETGLPQIWRRHYRWPPQKSFCFLCVLIAYDMHACISYYDMLFWCNVITAFSPKFENFEAFTIESGHGYSSALGFGPPKLCDGSTHLDKCDYDVENRCNWSIYACRVWRPKLKDRYRRNSIFKHVYYFNVIYFWTCEQQYSLLPCFPNF